MWGAPLAPPPRKQAFLVISNTGLWARTHDTIMFLKGEYKAPNKQDFSISARPGLRTALVRLLIECTWSLP